jgi:hypothetical protein
MFADVSFDPDRGHGWSDRSGFLLTRHVSIGPRVQYLSRARDQDVAHHSTGRRRRGERGQRINNSINNSTITLGNGASDSVNAASVTPDADYDIITLGDGAGDTVIGCDVYYTTIKLGNGAGGTVGVGNSGTGNMKHLLP